MDDIYKTAVRIAEKVAPDEVDLAPSIIEAIIEGGRKVKTLQRRTHGPKLGGFLGSIEGGNLFQVMEALHLCSTILSNLFVMGAATLTIMIHRLNLKDRKEQKEKLSLSPDSEKVFQEAIFSVAEQLKSMDIEDEKAERISKLAISALLEDPNSSKVFVDRLKKVK